MINGNSWALIIAPSIEPEGKKSVGSYYLEHSKALTLNGVKNKIVTVELSNRKVIPRLLQVESENVQYCKFIGLKPPVLGYTFWCFYCLLATSYFFLKLGKPSVIVAERGLLSGTAARWISYIYKIPYTVVEHSSDVMNGSYSKKDRKRLVRAYENAVKISSVSTSLAKSMTTLLPNNKKVEIIPNVAPVDLFQLDRKHDFSVTRQLKLVTVGNLVVNKRIFQLIPVIEELIDSGCQVKLDIIGDGPEYDTLEDAITYAGLEKFIELRGKLSRKELSNVLGKYDCFISASAYETFGVAYLEAFLSGLPVITTAGTGSNDIFENNDFLGINETGLQPDEFSELIKKYCYSDSLELRRLRNSYVLENFGYERVGSKLKSFVSL